MFKTNQEGYLADKNGNMYKVDGNQVTSCASTPGDNGCAQAKGYDKEKVEKEKEDWCSKIPMAAEIVGGVFDTVSQATNEDNMKDTELQKRFLCLS